MSTARRNVLSPIKIEIEFVNRATQYEVRAQKKYLNSKKHSDEGPHLALDFLEITENGLIIEAPKGCGSLGHHVTLETKIEDSMEKITLSVSARVAGLVEVQAHRVRLMLTLMQFDKKSWAAAHKLFEKKQNSVSDLFVEMKGNIDRDT